MKPAATFALLFGAALLLYLAGLAPTVGWGDSADLARRVVTGESLPTIRDYALFRWVASPFLLLPLGDAAWRVNLAVAVFGALAVGLLGALVHRVEGKAAAGLAAAAALAVSHTFWLLSEVAEVYTLAVLLHLLALDLAQRWSAGGRRAWLVAAAFVLGLALSHHAATVVLAPAVAVFLVRARSRLGWTTALCALAAGLAGVSLFLGAVLHHGLPGSGGFVAPAALVREGLMAGAFFVYQLLLPGALLALLGFRRLLRRGDAFGHAVLVAFGTVLAWGVLRRMPDKFNAYVFAWPYAALAVGVAVAGLPARLVRPALAGLLLVPPLTYAAVPPLTRWLGVDLVGARSCPYRDNARTFLFPPKWGDDGARRFAEEALRRAGAGSTLLADYTLLQPLRYLQQVEGRGAGVELVFVEPLLKSGDYATFLDARLARGPVLLATDRPAAYYGLPVPGFALCDGPRADAIAVPLCRSEEPDR